MDGRLMGWESRQKRMSDDAREKKTLVFEKGGGRERERENIGAFSSQVFAENTQWHGL